MSVHLLRAIEQLKKDILILSTKVEENLRDAVRSVIERDPSLAENVVHRDDEIDAMEVEVEEECLKILALFQPVAADLRFIVAALKINNDLERVGDIAVNIGERACYLAHQRPVKTAFDFAKMAELAQAMLRKSLDALVNLDPELAREVCIADDEVDELNRQIYVQVHNAIRKYPEDLESLIHCLGISRHLERVADLASNIGEEVIYMAEGEIIRHRVETYLQSAEQRQDS